MRETRKWLLKRQQYDEIARPAPAERLM